MTSASRAACVQQLRAEAGDVLEDLGKLPVRGEQLVESWRGYGR